LPRISHPSAVPTGRSSGCPDSRSFGIAVIRSSGCPELRTFRHRLMDPRVTSVRAPSGCAIGESPSLPEASYPLATPVRMNFRVAPALHSPLRRRSANFQVALNLGSFDVAESPISESPRISALRLRFCFVGLPRFRSCGWVDDESPAVLELCILSLRRG